PGSRFKSPGGIVSANICSISGKRASEQCVEDGTAYSELFQSGHVPGETCDLTSHDDEEELDEECENEEEGCEEDDEEEEKQDDQNNKDNNDSEQTDDKKNSNQPN